MSTTDSVSAIASQLNSNVTGKARDKLDQNSFMQLMIAQFKNQDPTKPQDPTQFLGQLAQFSTVSGIQEMQTSLSTLSDSLRSSQLLDGSVMVGHQVLVPNDTTAYAGANGVGGALDVPDGASTVALTVKDASGQTVRTATLNAQQGLNDFSWDGLTDLGGVAPAGKYTFSAVANLGGQRQAVPVLLNARVDSVTIDPKSNQLTVNTNTLGSVALSSVRRVM
jgi:flagellar basal-body rod modification protein FlgD